MSFRACFILKYYLLPINLFQPPLAKIFMRRSYCIDFPQKLHESFLRIIVARCFHKTEKARKLDKTFKATKLFHAMFSKTNAKRLFRLISWAFVSLLKHACYVAHPNFFAEGKIRKKIWSDTQMQ